MAADADVPASVTAYVGAGANLDDPAGRLRALFEEMRQDSRGRETAVLPGTQTIRTSSLYRTAPIGFEPQPEFINAVVELRTSASAGELLALLLALEARHGRVRTFANAPRRLDLDLLLYGDAIIDEPDLKVPHPRMHERRFVLEPLCEIAPACVIPGRGPARDWLARTLDQRVERLWP